MAYFIVYTDKYGNQWEARKGFTSVEEVRKVIREKYKAGTFYISRRVDKWVD